MSASTALAGVQPAPDRPAVGRVGDAEQVMRRAGLLAARPGGQHPQVGVELHRVGVDDLAADRLRQPQRQGGLAACGRARRSARCGAPCCSRSTLVSPDRRQPCLRLASCRSSPGRRRGRASRTRQLLAPARPTILFEPRANPEARARRAPRRRWSACRSTSASSPGRAQEAPADRRHGLHHHRLRVPGRAGRLRRREGARCRDHRAGHARRDRLRGRRCASGWR